MKNVLLKFLHTRISNSMDIFFELVLCHHTLKKRFNTVKLRFRFNGMMMQKYGIKKHLSNLKNFCRWFF